MKRIITVLLVAALAAMFTAMGMGFAQDDVIIQRGTVRYVSIEGGFWGIIGDDGKRYDPANLPQELKREGVRAEFKMKIREGVLGFHMWGTHVKILEYKIVR